MNVFNLRWGTLQIGCADNLDSRKANLEHAWLRVLERRARDAGVFKSLKDLIRDLSYRCCRHIALRSTRPERPDPVNVDFSAEEVDDQIRIVRIDSGIHVRTAALVRHDQNQVLSAEALLI